MKLAVVIPALNEENLIIKTLDSLSKQTNKNLLVIVADNGSTDNTRKIVYDYAKDSIFPLILIDEEKIGVGHARDTGSLKGIDMGAIYIAGTDADTLLPVNWVESIFQGFEKSKYDLLCGECDPFSKFRIDDDSLVSVLNLRSMLFKKVKPYLRGANFAITSKMYLKIGGFIQPLTKENKPAPGEDGALEIAALKQGAKICGCLATVFPHPRRYISNLINIDKFQGSVHQGGVVTQVRSETDLENLINTIPKEALNIFLDKIIVSFFNEYVVEVYKKPVLNKIYWNNSLKTLYPFTRQEIESDILTLDIVQLWSKYNQVFLKNIQKWQSNIAIK